MLTIESTDERNRRYCGSTEVGENNSASVSAQKQGSEQVMFELSFDKQEDADRWRVTHEGVTLQVERTVRTKTVLQFYLLGGAVLNHAVCYINSKLCLCFLLFLYTFVNYL